MTPTQEKIVAGAVAKIEQDLALAAPYSTSGTPNLDALRLEEVAVSPEELDEIIAQVKESIRVDEGLKDIFDAALGLVEGLLLRGRAFMPR
jgi:hypothetical protein